jgi:hypothetical protein
MQAYQITSPIRLLKYVIVFKNDCTKLRRARLLAREDPHNPGYLDTHPLVREYFGEQVRSQQTDGWKECSSRLFYYYRTLAPQLPNSFREMEPLFSAVICGCNAGLFRGGSQSSTLTRRLLCSTKTRHLACQERALDASPARFQQNRILATHAHQARRRCRSGYQ